MFYYGEYTEEQGEADAYFSEKLKELRDRIVVKKEEYETIYYVISPIEQRDFCVESKEEAIAYVESCVEKIKEARDIQRSVGSGKKSIDKVMSMDISDEMKLFVLNTNIYHGMENNAGWGYILRKK